MDSKENGVFINGKQQIIDLLCYLEGEEKQKLVRQMMIKNPSLTEELVGRSISFKQLGDLTNHEIMMIARQINPTVLGLALKEASTDLQRKILSIVSREFAEKAYEILITPISNENVRSQKAQARIREIMITMKRRRQLTSI